MPTASDCRIEDSRREHRPFGSTLCINQSLSFVPELLQPPEELRRADVVPARHVRNDDPGLQRLGNDGDLALVRPLASPLDAAQHLHPSWPMGLGDITIDVTMVVTIQPHGFGGSMISHGNATCGQDTAY